jgi:hypothetical protein
MRNHGVFFSINCGPIKMQDTDSRRFGQKRRLHNRTFKLSRSFSIIKKDMMLQINL